MQIHSNTLTSTGTKTCCLNNVPQTGRNKFSSKFLTNTAEKPPSSEYSDRQKSNKNVDLSIQSGESRNSSKRSNRTLDKLPLKPKVVTSRSLQRAKVVKKHRVIGNRLRKKLHTNSDCWQLNINLDFTSKRPQIPTDEELLSMEDIDNDFKYLEIKRPPGEDFFEEEDYVEDMELSNTNLRERIGEMRSQIEHVLKKAQLMRQDRNDPYIRPQFDDPELLTKKKELKSLYAEIKLKANEVTRLSRMAGIFI